MKNLKIFFLILLVMPVLVFSQTIEIISFGENPLDINQLVGSNLTINYKYTSEAGSSGNHIFIGLEILDANNQYVSSVSSATLENQTSGENIEDNVQLFVGSSHQLSADLPTGYYYQAKAILYASGGWTDNAWAGYWNTPVLILQNTNGYVFSENVLAKGADISWMTEMEADGYTWKDNDGDAKELMPLLKEYDLDAVRLRVWVDPSVSEANGWCDIDDLVKKAELANAQNIDILICIHYSDWWADPGQQTKPVAWTGFSVAQLETAVANHTTEILTALDAKGITPKWVQVGNETNDGMLWTTGKASLGGFANYAKFINAGLNAVKNYNTNIKTMLHIASGNDNSLFKWNIDGLINNGLQITKLDVIGMSLYPDASNWKTMVDATYENMLDLKSRYNKEVMMAEVGFNANQPSISHQFLTYMIEKTRQAEGLGVFYWEPIAHGNFTSYSKGAWDADGSPSIAMDAFIDNITLSVDSFENSTNAFFKISPNPSTDSILISNSKSTLESIIIYDITGRFIEKIKGEGFSQTLDVSNLKAGIYILNINNIQSIKFFKK